MPMWRCPHCGTPQAETARCWVCRRSSTACGTCRHFRRSVAAKVGYCGLDRRREPLEGDEIRACWEAGGVLADAVDRAPLPLFGAPLAAAGRRDFVEVGTEPADGLTVGGDADRATPGIEPAFDGPPPSAAANEPRWSLWADLEV